MVVDDNRHMRALIKSLLHALGIKRIADAAGAPEAFKELKHFSADLIITDWHMEPLDGLDFVRLVRTADDSPNPYVPIIMLTGHTEAHRVMEARDAGVNEFLSKPISARGLFSRMLKVIDDPRQFVRTKTYFGPDRRRRSDGPPKNMADRRAGDADDTGRNLGQDELDAILNS